MSLLRLPFEHRFALPPGHKVPVQPNVSTETWYPIAKRTSACGSAFGIDTCGAADTITTRSFMRRPAESRLLTAGKPGTILAIDLQHQQSIRQRIARRQVGEDLSSVKDSHVFFVESAKPRLRVMQQALYHWQKYFQFYVRAAITVAVAAVFECRKSGLLREQSIRVFQGFAKAIQ